MSEKRLQSAYACNAHQEAEQESCPEGYPCRYYLVKMQVFVQLVESILQPPLLFNVSLDSFSFFRKLFKLMLFPALRPASPQFHEYFDAPLYEEGDQG